MMARIFLYPYKGKQVMALKKAKTATLSGIVIPVDWNDDHEVTVAALATDDEKEYRIGRNQRGKELLGYLQRLVEVTGSLNGDENGRMVITVRSYIVK
jgi:hypothetical protein